MSRRGIKVATHWVDGLELSIPNPVFKAGLFRDDRVGISLRHLMIEEALDDTTLTDVSNAVGGTFVGNKDGWSKVTIRDTVPQDNEIWLRFVNVMAKAEINVLALTGTAENPMPQNASLSDLRLFLARRTNS